MSMRKLTIALLAALTLVPVTTACGSDKKANQNTETGMIEELHFPAESAASVGGLVNYNPYAPNPVTSTWLFEPLMVRNGLTCDITPWLATDRTWDGATKLTFTIRDGVKWSDGTAFTAKDVAFTFNLGKQYPGVDHAGLWGSNLGAPASSVTADGNKVVITFSGNAASKFDSIVRTQILPEHVYSSVGDPTKYIDKAPVSTGPFKVGSYNGRQLVLERRTDYWQADKIKVKKLVLEGQYDAAQASLKLRSGELDAYWGEIPNPEKTFVAADPAKNHFYYAPNGMTVLTMNVTKAPFNDVKFREAVSYAMNKQEMSDKATYGIMKPASQSGLKLPPAAKFLPSKYKAEDTILAFDTAKAESLLDAAGYKKGANGKRALPNGSPLSITFTVQAGWIDYQTMADVVVRGLTAAGLDAKVVATAPESADAVKKSGDFQMMLEYLHGGCQMAQNLGGKLHSHQIPTKTDIFPNVERWNDPTTDATVDKLAASTDDAEQISLVGQLVDVMMTQFPVTALIYAPARIIYRTDKAVGWPSEQDPYAHPSDDRLLILTHLAAAPK
jgi:peptide/nickel transport system substrate-binding protein